MIEPGTARAIDAALAANDIAAAAQLAERAITGGQSAPILFNLAAWAREEAGDFAGAHAILERALALNPRDPMIHAAIGSALRKEGRLADALAAIDRALAINPNLPAAWLDRGYALEAGGSFAAAEESFRRSAALDPASAVAWGATALVATRRGENDAARQAAGNALAIDPGNPAAHLAMGRLALDARDLDAAVVWGRAVAESNAAPTDRLLGHDLLGEAHGRLGDANRAFASFAAANAIFADQTAGFRASLPERQTTLVERIDAAVAACPAESWRPLPTFAKQHPDTHAFLLGFPRSGTTLVETILATLPGAATLEEQPTLDAVDRDFILPADGIARLAAIEDGGAWQHAYWDNVIAAGIDPAARLFVDMDTLKGIRLPAIARLFPNAKLIVMRRDPREVVWSCFRTAFATTSTTVEFATLEDSARLYDAMMRLTERCLATMPLDAHILRYDDLVADFDATTQKLCAFLNATWSPALRAFDKSAAARTTATASVSQVRRGLYDGRGQWRAHEARMASVMPILMPWVERFGFEA